MKQKKISQKQSFRNITVNTHTHKKKRSENPKMIQSLPWIKSTETLINDDKQYSKQ